MAACRRILLRRAQPRSVIDRFTPQGHLCRYHLPAAAACGKKKDTVLYCPLSDQTALRLHRCDVLSSVAGKEMIPRQLFWFNTFSSHCGRQLRLHVTGNDVLD